MYLHLFLFALAAAPVLAAPLEQSELRKKTFGNPGLRISKDTDTTCAGLLDPGKATTFFGILLEVRGKRLFKNGVALFTAESSIRTVALLPRSLYANEEDPIPKGHLDAAILNHSGSLFLLRSIEQPTVSIASRLRPGPGSAIRILKFQDNYHLEGNERRNKNPALLIVKPNVIYGIALTNTGDIPLQRMRFSNPIKVSRTQGIFTSVGGFGWSDNYLEVTQANGKEVFVQVGSVNRDKAYLYRQESQPRF